MSDLAARSFTGGLFIVSTLFSLWVLRKQYREYGKLNWFGTLIHITVYGVHGMFCGVLAWGNSMTAPPMGPAGPLGVAMMVLGLIMTAIAMDLFRSFTRWLGSDTPGLRTTGLYRWSRNPQFLAYALLLLGFFIAWWNRLAWLGILSYILMVYAIARVEEEHLARVYGDEYCARVPRFLGILKQE
jgi:protein-S-isoprenylcysteine O-methyltransferase Ste14